MKKLERNIRAAIIGGSEDGKTFLTAGLSRGLWRDYGVRSLVFDPFKGETDWGPQAVVFGQADFAKWRHTVENVKPAQRFAAIWDEGTSTGGSDLENVELVTRIRHNCPVFLFIGHGYSTLRPIMRGSLTEVFLAVRDEYDAKEWAKVMVDPSILQTSQRLKQYEFLHKRKHHEARVLRYTADQIRAGISI